MRATCSALPDRYADEQAAPLLCAGLIGYRAYAMAGDAPRLGLYGFGAAAHLIAQVAVLQGREVYAFTRPGDHAAQQLARELGAAWAGGSDEAGRRSRSTPRCSSPRSARWCRPRCARCGPAARWSAPAST